MTERCPFCEIVAGRAAATIVHEWDDALAIVPLGPVVEGHRLVIPRAHVSSYTDDAEVTGASARRAAQLGRTLNAQSNLITSDGPDATQSVFHLHWHLVPRAAGDGLALPWYSGKRRKGQP